MAEEGNTESASVDEIAARVSGLQTTLVLRNDAAAGYAGVGLEGHIPWGAGFSYV
jgi:hypothetical protein